ncbi:uncharacterized protein [Epargyreus clarus]|uniref:uncharacterized protein n=1 Tax=Epargyreus clarus TaxID=520877 RepID=UPI003C2C5B91
MPASTSGRQVAIVQPHRRGTRDLTESSPRETSQDPVIEGRLIQGRLVHGRVYQARVVHVPSANTRPGSTRNSNQFANLVMSSDSDGPTPTPTPATAPATATGRRSGGSPRNSPNLSNTTKATLWIESRKTSPRKSAKPQTPVKQKSPAKKPAKSPAKSPVKTPSNTPVTRNLRKVVSAKKSTPLRMAVLRKAQSAHKMKVTKIQAPLKIDSTKQAAIMLMTRHTPKSKPPSPRRGSKGPSYVVKKPSPVNKRNKSSIGNQTPKITPKRSSTYSLNQSSGSQGCASVIEIPDSATKSSITRRSTNISSLSTPALATTKKSALKDPSMKMGSRKTESIKFDLSNLENNSHNRSSDVMLVNETNRNQSNSDESTDITLRYSESPTSKSESHSPRRSLMSSRSNRILENSLGTSSLMEYSKSERRSLPIESPRSKKSLRGSIILKNALGTLDAMDIPSTSRQATKSFSDQSWGGTTASTRQTRTSSPRESKNNLESYSIVDLVSFNSNDSVSSRSGSVYTSAGSVSSYATYDTPTLGSSTPYGLRKTSTPDVDMSTSRTRRQASLLPKSRLSKQNSLPTTSIVTSDSVTTPENNEDTAKNITFNSTRISRATKSRSRINDSDIQLIEGEEEDSSPKSSKRIGKVNQESPLARNDTSINGTPTDSPTNAGTHTPENRRSPEEASTPMLRIQSLLNASQQSTKSPNAVSMSKKSNLKRKTIGVLRSDPRRGRPAEKSKSLNIGRSLRGRDISANFDESDEDSQNEEDIVTPKSAVKLVQEGVKNKHSTAKKPQSKRSLIDDLNESDIVKQLFNSPVKRKLSQSMTEFSRKKLFEDDERPVRSTRATIAAFGRTPDTSLMNRTEQFSPEVFVSPLNTPTNSPNMTGIKRLFQKNTPNNDLRNVRGVKGLLRTPRYRKSTKNDLTNVSGVKNVFARSPRNRLSDVRIKNVFAASPKNDLRRITGVKALFGSDKKKRRSPRNELDDVRGVRNLFQQNSPKNVERNHPKNDLTDVRGVKRLFRQEKQRNELSDVSGVEQLFHESGNSDSTFDLLLGRPPIRAYAKSRSFTTNKVDKKKNTKLKSKSLHDSITQITSNVEEWLENELRKRVRTDVASEATTSKGKKSTPNKSKNVSKINLIRELQKLSTDTFDGTIPVIISRTRNSSILKNDQSDLSRKKSASEVYSAHTLPIKKRSLVEASINKSSNDRSNKLPIKKRAVVHSTPVKGRVNMTMTMNASEIGRMSPISSEDKISEIGTVRSSSQPQVSPKTKLQASKAKATVDTSLKEKSIRSSKPSPKKTRLTKAAQRSPAVVRATRGRKSGIDNQEMLNVKKRRSSIVITKKAPILSPKPSTPRLTRRGKTNVKPQPQNVPKVSPKKTRSTRGQQTQVSIEVKVATPKNTRAKVRRTSVIVTKPSPKLNPRATRNPKQKVDNSIPIDDEPQTKGLRKTRTTEPEPKAKNKRKMIESSKEPQMELEPARKTRKTNTVQEPKSRGKKADVDKSASIVQTRRSRKPAENEAQNKTNNAQNKRTRKVTESKDEEPITTKRGKKVEPQASEDSAPKRRGRNTKAEDIVVPEVTTKRKGRTTVSDEPAPKTAGRGRSSKAQEVLPEVNKKTRKMTEDPVPQVTGRGRKRKNTEQEDVPAKEKADKTKQTRNVKTVKNEGKQTKPTSKEVKNTRSKKGAGDATEAKNNQKKTTAKAVVAETARKTRNTAQKEDEAKPVRGTKAATVADSVPQEGGRKKRTIVEISDAKENKKEPTKKPRGAASLAARPEVGRGGRARRR